MTETKTQEALGLDKAFPERVFLLFHAASQKYGCYCHQSVHGLACFSTESNAFRFAEWLDLFGMSAEEVSFDEAREVAKSRPLPISSLMLLDSLASPVIHYVR